MSRPADQMAAGGIQGYVTSTPPKSPRAAGFSDMNFGAGIASNAPARDLKGRWVKSNRMRWHKSSPEKIGGWAQVPLSAPSQAPIFSQTPPSLLLHFDGSSGQTTTVDSSTYNNVMTMNVCSLQTNHPKFGTAALGGLGGHANNVSTPITPAGPLDLSTGDFTIEFWFYLNSYEGGFTMPILSTANGATGIYLVIGSQQLGIGILGGSAGFASGIIAPLGRWVSAAFVRKGNVFSIWQDGVPGPNFTQAGNIGTDTTLYIAGGNPFGTGLDGQIDELRITKGVAIYTPGTPYVPNQAPFVLPFLIPGVQYVGTVRATCDWASLDGQYWVAFATELKLYLVNNNTMFDITPIRQTSNTANVFSTINTQTLVTVHDINHRANQGDHMTIIGPVVVGGITLNGDYAIVTVIDPDTYTINQATPATSTVNNGGGSVTIQYDISGGLATNGFLYGYGAGPYGAGTYGTPRPIGSGVPAKLRTWSLSNWGQDLVASYNNGELYWWQWSAGPNSRAALVANAPTDIQRILVNADSEFLIAVGASDALTNAADPMNVRWCSEGDLNDWTPVILPVENTAGGQRLQFGSRMVTAIQSRQQNLLWSDTQMYQMQFLGEPDIFGFNELGKCFIVGPNAVIDVNGVAYMMCFDEFMIYDGTLRVLECDMWETVFDNFDRSQAEMVYCASFMLKSEVTWWYPSADGSDTIHYATYNYDLNCWYGGIMPRTCYHDVTPALVGYIQFPYGFNGGFMYQHEVGFDEQEGTVTNAMYYFLQSWDIGQNSDKPMLINSIIPNFDNLRNGCQFSYLVKEYPRDAAYTQIGPFIVTPDTSRVDERAFGAETALLIEAAQYATNPVGPTPANPTLPQPSILLHFDGTTGTQVFTDSSPNGNIVTPHGTVALSNVQKEFGSASVLFGGGYLSAPIVAGGPLDVGLGDFTISGWMYAGAQGGGQGILFYLGTLSGGSTPIYLYYQSSSNTLVGSAFGSVSSIAASVLPNVWHHIAMVVQGTVIKLYVDGVAGTAGGTSGRGSIGGATWVLSLGDQQPNGVTPYTGYLDDFYIAKYAVYTANFVPPTSPVNASTTIALGQDVRLGIWQAMATPHGKRIGTATRGGVLNTNNP